MEGKNVALIAVPAAVVALVLISSFKAKAAGLYVCPYCGLSFETYEELVAHVQNIHPGERIPLEIEWD